MTPNKCNYYHMYRYSEVHSEEYRRLEVELQRLKIKLNELDEKYQQTHYEEDWQNYRKESDNFSNVYHKVWDYRYEHPEMFNRVTHSRAVNLRALSYTNYPKEDEWYTEQIEKYGVIKGYSF